MQLHLLAWPFYHSFRFQPALHAFVVQYKSEVNSTSINETYYMPPSGKYFKRLSM
jgi:uncharacterized protein YecE (DUF72 family)